MALFLGTIVCLTTDCMGKERFDYLDYENPGLLVAIDVLPPELRGTNYSIRGSTTLPEDTSTYGFSHQFEITSIYGNFEAHCIDMVRIRVHELNAISIIQDIKKTKAFSEAIKKAGKSPYKNAVSLILHPVDTLTGVPKGKRRLFTRSSEMIKSGSDHSDGRPDDALVNFLKLKRLYAYKLGVDVYSSNKALQKEMNSVSVAGFASGAGTSLLFTKAGASAEDLMLEDAYDLKIITRTPFLDEIDKLLLDNTQDGLQLINREKLKQMGVKESMVKEFLSHPSYSPRKETIIIHALAEMDGARNRDQFIKQALRAEHEEIALLYENLAELMHSYHKNVNPIIEIIPVRSSAVGYTTDQTIICVQPHDYVYWTKRTDLFCSELKLLLKSEARPVKHMYIWFTGKFTPMAKEAFASRGMLVKENMREVIFHQPR